MYTHLAFWIIATVVLISGGRFARIVLIEVVDFLVDGIYWKDY